MDDESRATPSSARRRSGDRAPLPKVGGRERLFQGLGRWIVRHPYYPIVIWIVLLLLAVPTLSMLGNVETNSATVLPDNAPSVVAAHDLGRLFPNSSSPASSLVVIQGQNITGPVGKSTVLRLQSQLENDSTLTHVQSVDSLYSSYAAYLGAETQLAVGSLAPGFVGNASLYTAVNSTAPVAWLAPANYSYQWLMLASGPMHGQNVNYSAYQSARYALATIPDNATRSVEENLLLLYYTAFNGSTPCSAAFNVSVSHFLACSDAVARKAIEPVLLQSPLVPTLVVGPVMQDLGIENFSDLSVRTNLTLHLLAPQTGLSPSWLATVHSAFPSGVATVAQEDAWAWQIVRSDPISAYPLPIPSAIYGSFVDPSNSLTLLAISFTVGDDYVGAGGATPVYDDIHTIGSVVPTVLSQTDPGHSLTYWQTGQAALDLNENDVLSSGLVVTLPLSVSVLLLITALYFRSPVTPLVAFGPIAMALVISMGGTYAIGTFITKVDSTTLTLQDAFVLGVGTDYAIFLFSRYREEIRKGKESHEAIVTTVTWAGESITISGLTVILSTIALAFSGVAMLNQWGLVLSLSVLIGLLVALTTVPAVLTLLGPRVFWPAKDHNGRARKSGRKSRPTSYFRSASRFAVKKAALVVGAAALISIPIAVVAYNAPVTYDFYSQLPSNQPSSEGLQALANHFGPGHTFPIDVLVTFSQPLVSGNQTNALEFQEIDYLTRAMNATSGVVAVDSPTGTNGEPLSTWLALSSTPTPERMNLQGTLDSYVGTDGRTVLFTVVPAASGLSGAAIDTLNRVEANVSAYGSSHPFIATIAYGGAASELRDLDNETTQALDRMVAIVVVGLLLVLLALLASVAIPLLAVATIGMSIAWAWALTYLVMTATLGVQIFFFDRVVLFVIVLGLGMDYNIFILTRIREERTRVPSTRQAIVRAVSRTGGVVTAAALILASVFFVLATSSFALLATIGFSLGIAVVLDAMLVRTYVMPSLLALLRERVWWVPGRTRSFKPPKSGSGS